MRSGDTLAGIALQLWGDTSLWYKLAEANGLTAASPLIEGQRLILPAGVARSAHNASTLKPYDPSDIIGDLSPTATGASTARPPKKNGCGMLGKIMLIAVAVAVSVVTYGAMTGPATGLLGTIGSGAVSGAAGSIARQVVGVATGIQDKFSFKQVAIGALSGAVSGGVGNVLGKAGVAGSKLLTAAARGAAGSAITQGISVAVGLQQKFDWAGVAVAGAASGAAQFVGSRLPGASRTIQNFGVDRHGAPIDLPIPAGLGNVLAGNAAGAIAGAAARSLIQGTSFGDNLIAALPDAIGSSIGTMVADQVAYERAIRRQRHP